ncbi:MAG: hypothetical protein IKL88_07165 [Erysipelotrichales bacterium]|nr:hypothetical protein [Erysipelotrichales bacterium]
MKISRDTLKFIALVTMTIDHIGYLLFPDMILLRAIGRLAFPLYAYFVAEGFRYTRDRRAYLTRLLVSAVLTQVLFNTVGLDFVNVLFTFAISTCVLWIAEKGGLIAFLGVYIGVLVSIAINCDYSFYGVLMVVLFYLEGRSFIKMLAGCFLLTTVYLLATLSFDINAFIQAIQYFELNHLFFIQYLCILAVPLLALYDHKKSIYSSLMVKRIVQYSFYLYYPLHLVILKLIGG